MCVQFLSSDRSLHRNSDSCARAPCDRNSRDERDDVQAAEGLIDFNRDVRPIFESNCLECHGPKDAKEGFRVDEKDTLLAYIEPGDLAASSPVVRLLGYHGRRYEDASDRAQSSVDWSAIGNDQVLDRRRCEVGRSGRGRRSPSSCAACDDQVSTRDETARIVPSSRSAFRSRVAVDLDFLRHLPRSSIATRSKGRRSIVCGSEHCRLARRALWVGSLPRAKDTVARRRLISEVRWNGIDGRRSR